MIRLLAHLSPLFRHQVASLFQSSCCVSPVELTDEREEVAKSQIIQPRDSLALYKSFFSFWLRMCLCQQMEVEFEEDGDVEVRVYIFLFVLSTVNCNS
jgi:hypothetical protein